MNDTTHYNTFFVPDQNIDFGVGWDIRDCLKILSESPIELRASTQVSLDTASSSKTL